jgi:hypothetical protein
MREFLNACINSDKVDYLLKRFEVANARYLKRMPEHLHYVSSPESKFIGIMQIFIRSGGKVDNLKAGRTREGFPRVQPQFDPKDIKDVQSPIPVTPPP